MTKKKKIKGAFWLKIFKFALRAFANDYLIPYLQKEINAGAIDAHVDRVLDYGINELIDGI